MMTWIRELALGEELGSSFEIIGDCLGSDGDTQNGFAMDERDSIASKEVASSREWKGGHARIIKMHGRTKV